MPLSDEVRRLMQEHPLRSWLIELDAGHADDAADPDDLARAAGIEPLGHDWHELHRPGPRPS